MSQVSSSQLEIDSALMAGDRSLAVRLFQAAAGTSLSESVINTDERACELRNRLSPPPKEDQDSPDYHRPTPSTTLPKQEPREPQRFQAEVEKATAAGAEPRRWPEVEHPDGLPGVVQQVIAAVHEVEDCWNREAIDSAISRPNVQATLGLWLVWFYGKMAFGPEEALCKCREVWVNYALEDFRRACASPTQVFRSKQRSFGGCYPVEHNGTEIILRKDQVASLRFWGLGVEPADSGEAVSVSNYILKEAMQRLGSDMGCIARMCQAHSRGMLRPDGLSWSGEGQGTLFERLVLDVLNEHECRARRAPLVEDLFEWTDLRVAYPGLDRKHGARVQVKFIGDEVVHDHATGRWRFPESYVVVSPLKLAEFIERLVDGEARVVIDPGFWDSLGSEPVDRAELAAVLLKIFQAAIHVGIAHPLGPMAQVPSPIRHCMRLYVASEAFAATEKMRKSIAERSNRIPPWRSRFSNR